MNPTDLQQLLRDKLEGVVHVEISDMTGTGDHFEAVIVASAFEGLTPIAQHQAVYAALGDLMAGPIHALALKTFTPARWSARQAG